MKPATYHPTFWPVHDCPTCGHPVQQVARRKDRVFIEEADTGRTHVCPVRDAVGDLMICECGATLLIGGGLRLNWSDGEPHVCSTGQIPHGVILL